MNAPNGTYYGEGLPNLGMRSKRAFRATGEFRAPKRGEYFLSGAIITAYRAPTDLSTEYWIAHEVEVVKGYSSALITLMAALTRGGKWQGNPYAADEVRAVLKEIAAVRGHRSLYDALNGLPEYENYKRPE